MAEAIWNTVHSELEEAAAAWHTSDPSSEWIDGERRLELLLQVMKEWTQRRLAKTRVREEIVSESDDESEEEGQGYFKPNNKWADRQKKPIQVVQKVADYSPSDEAERVWDSLLCVLTPDGATRPLPAYVGSCAMEATVAMLNVLRRFGDDKEEAAKRSVAEMQSEALLNAVLGDKAVVPRSVAYPFVRDLVQWDYIETVATPVFQAVLAHVSAA